ncbi:Zinc finger C3HC4 type (RING finger) containing protein [Lotmaria passim]
MASTPAFATAVAIENDGVVIPDSSQLMRSKKLQFLADQLQSSLTVLYRKLSGMEKRMQVTGGAALLPFQLRRAKQEKDELEREIAATQKTIKRLLLMSDQIAQIIKMKQAVFKDTKASLLKEIDNLQHEVETKEETIRRGYMQRISMLQRYWPWRQLKELGDITVGKTFEEELSRGPRYRNVGVQNNIQSDYIRQQIHWLQKLGCQEGIFRNHLHHLDVMVEDLNDVTELLETAMTCGVCGLIYEEPVLFWPCGHSFCLECFASLAIAPSLFRCPTCGSIGSEGYLHNLLLADTIAKWMFKDSGYGDLQAPLSAIRVHLARFRQDEIQERVRSLQEELQRSKREELLPKNNTDDAVTISYRLY